MRYFISDNKDGGGIAFNVKSLCHNFRDVGSPCEVIFLNDGYCEQFFKLINANSLIILYSTSGKSLIFSLLVSIIRLFLFKITNVAPIIYHPRFADAAVSKFRSLIRKSLQNLSGNLVYYCDEAKVATNIHHADCPERIIGLASNFDNVVAHPINNEKFDDKKYNYKITTIGRLVDFKMGYIRSLMRFAKDHPHVLVTIGGFGPHEKEVAQESELLPNLVYLGKLSIEESKYLVQKSDYYVGMGTTLADSIAVGTVAIVAIESSSCGLTSGYFGNENAVCYGEFSSEKSYLGLYDFLRKVVSSVDVELKTVAGVIQPHARLLSLEPSFISVSLVCSIKSLLYLLVAFSSRKLINQRDYH